MRSNLGTPCRCTARFLGWWCWPFGFIPKSPCDAPIAASKSKTFGDACSVGLPISMKRRNAFHSAHGAKATTASRTNTRGSCPSARRFLRRQHHPPNRLAPREIPHDKSAPDSAAAGLGGDNLSDRRAKHSSVAAPLRWARRHRDIRLSGERRTHVSLPVPTPSD